MEDTIKDDTVVDEPIKEIEVSSTGFEMSSSIGALAEALSKAQGELGAVGKGKQGYGYSYADLASVLEVSRAPLSNHGLAVTQGIETVKGESPWVKVTTLLMHSSGEWIKNELQMPLSDMKGMSPAQMVGAVSTYGRRYSMQAIVNIASEDNDASNKGK